MPAFTPSEALSERDGIVTLRGSLAEEGAKVLARLAEGKSKAEADARLAREWELLRGLSIHGVARARGLERIHGERALLLDDPGGKTLDAWLRARPANDIAGVLEIGIAIAKALETLHANRVVHAALSPALVLVAPSEDEAFLYGFSLALRLPKGSRPELWRGPLPSAIAYAAPEQTGRLARPVDERTDLYSFGVMLYEMLTGETPFSSSDPAELVHAHLTKTPPTPKERKAEIPSYLSTLVMRLLAKLPEDRYRKARGARIDLEHCLEAYRQGSADVQLGKADISGELQTPDQVLGREKERAALREAFQLASAGQPRLVAVTGPPGIGRNALIRALEPMVLERGGTWVECPLERREQERPLAAIALALSSLAKKILAEPKERFQAIAERLLSRSSTTSGRAIVDLVPALSAVLGPQPPLPETGADEAQNRQDLAAEACLQALATKERPAVIVLKDAQFVDIASLDLLRRTLTGRRYGHFLVLLSYPEAQVPAMHPLTGFLSSLSESAFPIFTVNVGPLDLAHTKQFVAQTLGMETAGLEGLAELVYEKTGGVPFFIRELLERLGEEGLLYFDEEHSRFGFHLDAIAAAALAENVSALIEKKLDKLTPSTQDTVRIASAIGHSVDPAMVALVQGIQENEIVSNFEEATRAGIFLPASQSERQDHLHAEKARARYRFSHERLREAAQSRLPEELVHETHLEIGRRMLDIVGQDSELLFEALLHLRLGGKTIQSKDERAHYARLERKAGEQARAKIAYDAARAHFWHALGWLGPSAWEEERDLTFELYFHLAECEALTDRRSEAIAIFEELLKHANPQELIRIDRSRIDALVRKGELTLALEIGSHSLAREGIFVLEEHRAANARKKPKLSLDAPAMVAPAALALEELLLSTAVPAYYTQHLIFERILDIWLTFVEQNGHSERSAFGYVLYALSLVRNPETVSEAYAVGKFALSLDDRVGKRTHTCKIIETFAGNIAFFRDHLRDVLAQFPKAIDAGLSVGDFTHVAYIAYHTATMRLCVGDELGQTLEHIEANQALANKTRDALSIALVSVSARAARHLTGQARINRPEEEELGALFSQNDLHVLACYAFSTRALLAIIEERFDEAMRYIELAEARLEGLEGQFFSTQLAFYSALTRLEKQGAAALSDPITEKHLHRLADLAQGCAENYAHLHIALLAKMAQLREEHGDARELFDEALAQAKMNDFPNHEAMIAEMAMRYYSERNKPETARVYLARARAAYQRWGAREKVNDIDRKHDLRPRVGPPSIDFHDETAARSLDAFTIAQAAEAIAGEIELDKLTPRLLRTLADLGGAEHGALVLARQNTLVVDTTIGQKPSDTQIGLSLPILVSTDIAPTVVELVAQTRTPLAITRPIDDARFANDERIILKRPASILCFPLVHRGALSGIVYLEHRTAKSVFSKERVDTLSLLSAQAAIAIENAQLIADVRARTSDLSAANLELHRELAERERAEQERTTLKQGIIELQNVRLKELRAPFIPLTHNIMVMPLVGTLDRERMEEALSIAVEGTAEKNAKVVLVDIMGVKRIDETTAQTMLRMVEALSLLGAEAIITGTQPDVAKTLIDIDPQFGSKVKIQSSLKSGIQYALRKTR